MWAQAVGEIHFLRLHRDDSETERPGVLVAVTNTRRQPQSEEPACNDNGFEEVIAGDSGAKTSVCSNYVDYLVSFSA